MSYIGGGSQENTEKGQRHCKKEMPLELAVNYKIYV
jgi:hypothetical protein